MTDPLAKLKQILEVNKLDAILISSISNIIYLTKYSGFSKEEREAYLLIVAQPQGLTHKTPGVLGYILTDARYSQAVKTLIPDFKLIEISSNNSVREILKSLKTKHKIKKLGVEENNLTAKEYKAITKHFNDTYHHSVSAIRTIKDKYEISAIEKACQLGDKTFDYVLKKIKLGVSEKELAFEIEFFIKKNGGDLSFPSIVAFGKNSATPHHQTSNQRLASSGQFVLLDFGVKLDNYCSDMTRTIFFGKPTNEQEKMYQTVLEAQKKAINSLHDISIYDAMAKSVDKIARDYITSKGYETIPHSVGHGIGIDVHEAPHLSPNSKDILKEGMVFSVEPGIYIPNFGGVRIEDLVVLEANGPRLLTHSPKAIIEI